MQHYRNVDRIDLLVAVRIGERDVREVRVLVLEVLARQTHHGLALVLTGRRRFLALLQGEVCFRIQRVADRVDCVSGDRMIFTVIRHAARVAVQHYRNVDRIDRQFAGGEGRGCVVAGDVFVRFVYNGELRRFTKAAILICSNIRALGRRVGDRQDVAICETFDRVIIGLDRFARASDFANRVAGLFGAVVGRRLVLDRNLEFAAGHRQGAEVFLYSIVVLVDLAPVDGVGVVARADIRPAAGDRDRDRFAGCKFDLRRRFCRQLNGTTRNPIYSDRQRAAFRQRRAVVLLARAARGDRDLRRHNIQTSGTDKQIYAVVIILRQVCQSDRILEIFIIAHIALCDAVIVQTCSSRIKRRFALHCIPNVVEIRILIAFIADQDVVLDVLFRIREAGIVELVLIRSGYPAVGLDTNRDRNLRHFERAADIADRIVVTVYRIVVCVPNDRILRRDLCAAGFDTTVIIRCIIRIRIGILDRSQRITFFQSLHTDLIVQILRQFQRGAVIRLALGHHRDGDLLLIEQRKLQTAARCNVVRDLIYAARFRSVIFGINDRLVEFPARDRRACKRILAADLQRRYIIRPNRFAVHVDEMHRDGRRLEARIVERQNVLLRVRRQNQRLFDRVRIEVASCQCRIIRIIDRCGQFDNGAGVAGHTIRLFLRNRITCAGLAVCDHISHRIAGGLRLGAVDEGDDVFAFILRQRQRFAVGLRTVARNRDRLLGDRLTDHKVRVGDRLIVRNANIIHTVYLYCIRVALNGCTYIMYGIAQRRARPVRIDRGVRRDLGVPIIERIAIRRGVPAFKDIARLGRCAGVRRLLVLIDRLAVFQMRRWIVAVYKADRIGRCNPLGIENQRNAAIGCASRHLIEYIRGAFTLFIVVPTTPCIVVFYTAFSLRRRPVICRACNRSIKLYAGDRL